MKKLLLIALLFAGCVGSEKKEAHTIKSKPPKNNNHIYEYEFDGCQYITVIYNYGAGVTHKGNCSNPIHKDTIK